MPGHHPTSRRIIISLALALTCLPGMHATCITSTAFTTCGPHLNGEPLHSGLVGMEAAIDNRVRQTIAQILGGDLGAINDVDRDYCGSKGPICCFNIIELMCRTTPFVMAREMGFGDFALPDPDPTTWCEASNTTSHENCMTWLDSCQLGPTVDLRPIIPDPFSPVTTTPDVAFAGFIVPHRQYCELQTGHGKPELTEAELAQNIEEDKCDFASFINQTVLAERAVPSLNTAEADCTAQIRALRTGRFGPPSDYANFQATCKSSCLLYYDLLDPLERSTGCRCELFTYQPCRHLNPNQILCKYVEVCHDPATYQLQVCAPTACGSTATNEDDWRKCGAGASGPHPVLLSFAAAVLGWRVMRMMM